MPFIEMTAASLVPPPMSTTRLPVGVLIGIPAPRAAAKGSGIRYASRPPAWMAASWTARLSTLVTPTGTLIAIRGLNIRIRPVTFWIK
jgi:hypothetical protein